MCQEMHPALGGANNEVAEGGVLRESQTRVLESCCGYQLDVYPQVEWVVNSTENSVDDMILVRLQKTQVPNEFDYKVVEKDAEDDGDDDDGNDNIHQGPVGP